MLKNNKETKFKCKIIFKKIIFLLKKIIKNN